MTVTIQTAQLHPCTTAPVPTKPAPGRCTAGGPALQQYVHKLAADEVLLTRWRRTGPDAFAVGARWPRQHAFYQSDNGDFDPLLFAETVRQNIPLISHVAYDVPVGHQLIWQDFSYRVDPAALRIEDGPAELELRITCSDVVRRRARLASLTMSVVALRAGRRAATAVARFTSNPPAVYQRLRGERADAQRAMAAATPLTPPIPAALVGRRRAADVVLADSRFPQRWQLRNDTSHPILFDHPVDHSPGMLLLEAARQAAHAQLGSTERIPVGFDAKFYRYIELDEPCWIAAETVRDQDAVEVVALQGGRIGFSCTVTTAPATSA
ncbi:ScbA/BarX family gamma-butyrolactone biosynthesis protein [Kitasatospora sp. GAS204B]|uniref:ScbA/BarX family gamma-butyrolactone biosynthesis protein n=1 Tax=unclassified Kitasatospora TaxID=2633591 RepID=UPI00247722FC|nr:ScbA/BarX family gamma-butyrolactone biosynthesis protein [Kitasatospora sp. GAS204B]MDH6118105.1 hypothetical protein [Kitasatospora sp. GAS204B]